MSNTTTTSTATSTTTTTITTIKTTTTTSTATTTVFPTVELLENILFQLALIDTMRVQRVARCCKGTIAGSPKLQVELFLKPVKSVDRATKPKSRFALYAEQRYVQLNKIPCSPRRTSRPGEQGYNSERYLETALETKTYAINPFAVSHVLSPLLEQIWKGRRNTGNPYTAICKALRSSLPQDATWRNMLLTQPPDESLKLHISKFSPQLYHRRTLCSITAGSRTLGGIVDNLLEFLQNTGQNQLLPEHTVWDVAISPKQY
jgi:hypothetical protein